MRRLLFLNKDAGSPLRCLGTNTALRKTCGLERRKINRLTDHSVAGNVGVGLWSIGVWEYGWAEAANTGVAEDELYSFSHRLSVLVWSTCASNQRHL